MLWNGYNHLSVDYGCSEFTTTIIERVALFRKNSHHITMVLLLMAMLNLPRLWPSDRVFKSLDKNADYFHLIEWSCFYKTKLASKCEFWQENTCKWHTNSQKISLQKWFINLPTLENCLSSSNFFSSLFKTNSPSLIWN